MGLGSQVSTAQLVLYLTARSGSDLELNGSSKKLRTGLRLKTKARLDLKLRTRAVSEQTIKLELKQGIESKSGSCSKTQSLAVEHDNDKK
ncbi:hypothetical protein EVAR_68995_1 [Eumeta japonica]|uniref:Uncharacterized protein n=1 Tax=Eumeta variegata TaxID=151549 RepID=A0A4C2A5Q5_EUMVA|nr:hypothetical protein EVAR_68995_1 [Eumeta japonica]